MSEISSAQPAVSALAPAREATVASRLPWSGMLWNGPAILLLGFMFSPLIIVILFSFGSSAQAVLPFGHPTLHWYRALFARQDLYGALQNSAEITLSVGVISTIIGTLAGFALAALPPRTVEKSMFIITLPVAMPPLVLALALAVAISALQVPMGVLTVIAGHLVFTQPFVILVVFAQMRDFDSAILESARDLGGSPWTVFRTVTLPIIRPVVIGATLIAMSISLDDFVITFFTIGSGLTLPTMIWGMLRTSISPIINALGTLVLFATIGSTALALKLTGYRG
jgi:spermidine/putrescine transport system permease protein